MALMPEHGGAGHVASSYSAGLLAGADYPRLEGEHRFDVVIVGGGLTGLGAAVSLAERGIRVAVIEANKIGWGASGRNGGQVHPGQRRDPDWLSARLGEPMARRLTALSQQARAHLTHLMTERGIECDFRPGLIEAVHRARDVAAVQDHAAHLETQWGLGPFEVLDRDALANAIGSDAYFGGVRDLSGGHLDPLKLTRGLGALAQKAGATIFEDSRVEAIRHGAEVSLITASGIVRAGQVLLAGNGYLGGLDRDVNARILPLNNYIVTTAPLDKPLIPGGEAVADTRFVVYYWRQLGDGRLLFGGGETYGTGFPADISGFVRRHLVRVYPQLADVRITHAWGGTLGVTMNRLPYVRRLRPNVFVAAGFSGQGVMLAPFVGHVVGEAMAGTLERFDLFAGLPVPKFPGGPLLRFPTQVAAMSFFALMDRL